MKLSEKYDEITGVIVHIGKTRLRKNDIKAEVSQLESSLAEAREEIERLNGVLDKVDEMTKHIEAKVENVECHCNLLIAENVRLREIVGAYHPEYFNNCPCPQCSDALVEETV